MSEAVVGLPAATTHRGIGGWVRNPWRKPRFLQAITIAYIVWSIVPVIVAILISFNAGRSNATIQAFGLHWWNNDPDGLSLWQDPVIRRAILQTYILSFATMLIAVPLGVAFAIGLDRWHGRPATASNFLMLVTFVLPEIVIGLSIRLVIQHLFTFVQLGTFAQILGLATFQISYPVIIVRARMLVIPKEFEEGGMDLGASPRQAVRRVLLPMLYPAILASFAVVFADTVDDFVTASYLSGPANSQALSQFIYTTARASATPATNAAATVMLITTTAAIALGYVAYKRLARGQEGADVASFSQL
jgi:spermidine/putrescine transport system permease protein